MRSVLTVTALLVLCVPLTWAQEPPPGPPEGTPPDVNQTAPPPAEEPPPPAAMPPEIVAPAAPTLAERAAQYYERTREVGPEVAAWRAVVALIVGAVAWSFSVHGRRAGALAAGLVLPHRQRQPPAAEPSLGAGRGKLRRRAGTCAPPAAARPPRTPGAGPRV